MPKKQPQRLSLEDAVVDYRHDAKRKNIPPAGLAPQGRIREAPKLKYEYNPHLPPVLRFDDTGKPDALPELLLVARTRPLTEEEARTLAEALRAHEPWLEWSGKREQQGFEVDPVALHIHERVSAQAILKIAARERVQRSLFADPEQEYREAVQFYQHDVDWANRMILGDSLQVMASLARREDLAGKVQMIYVDPPYGIRFASNFQPEIGRRDVKDKETDLTREPEMVKAYRDTWKLGIHSYLTYLRDRLYLCKGLLADTGSIFVQIGDENLHRVRALMDEVFRSENFCSVLTFRKTPGLSSPVARTNVISSTTDFVIWYAQNITHAKYRQLYQYKQVGGEGGTQYTLIENKLTGEVKGLAGQDIDSPQSTGNWCVCAADNLFSSGHSPSLSLPFEWGTKTYPPALNEHWKTTSEGLERLGRSERLLQRGTSLSYKRYFDDFAVFPVTNMWVDTSSSFMADKLYVVQTNTKVIERCILMTTDPGDLVLDPTCGSGTTAYVAEQWGRRWITIDTSRVSIALARQRLLTASLPMYKVQDGGRSMINQNGQSAASPNPAKGFVYESVPHITLKSIAQNAALDPIFARHQPILNKKLNELDAALAQVTPEVRARLLAKLAEKDRREGKRAITDADRRRWVLPKEAWKEWEVPFDADEEWPRELKDALAAYRAAWRAKMDEVNACIAANAEPEELVDRPEVVKRVVRVSGPFTMEAVMPAEESLDAGPAFDGAPEALETFGEQGEQGAAAGGDGKAGAADEPANAEAYLDKMVRLLKADGVRFPANKVARFGRLELCPGAGDLHAEGEWQAENGEGQARKAAVSFGPQYGPVTAVQVENALWQASRRGYDDVVLAGFSFDGAAQAAIQEDPNPRVHCHLAHIRPDVQMGDLLKETPHSQLFTVFGLPRTELRRGPDGQYVVEMQGVDIYNPVDSTLLPTSADKVAAWFLDSDYDGRTFCITQAFFPDKSAWQKLARALRGKIDEEAFAAFSGTVSLPFPAGKHRRAAVKVIDPRGNEVMRVHSLDGGVTY